jgi:hypothetical protein
MLPAGELRPVSPLEKNELWLFTAEDDWRPWFWEERIFLIIYPVFDWERLRELVCLCCIESSFTFLLMKPWYFSTRAEWF